LRVSFLNRIIATESGNSLFEVLIAMSLFGIYGLLVTQGNVMTLKMFQSTEMTRIASSLAVSKMESVSSHNVAELNDSFNETEDEVVWPGTPVTFKRTTTVETNADNSRTIKVIVNSNNAIFSKNVELTTTVAQWE
jgi:Tfp pilus assembly protein PilV